MTAGPFLVTLRALTINRSVDRRFDRSTDYFSVLMLQHLPYTSHMGSHRRRERRKTMTKSIKRLVVTGAVVMVMMSFASPALALDNGQAPGLMGFGGAQTIMTATSNQR